MDVSAKATRVTAFGTGLAVLFPVLLGDSLTSSNFVSRFGVSLAWLVYLVAWILYVHGQVEWDTYRWVPADGIWSGLFRGLFWLCGAGISVVAYELAAAG